ncbi:MAG: hypothetical protein N2050_06750 [Flavobacteriales bacterium]|nr:hypothetical protein [Flavobacteriales bacterium]
MPKKFFHFALFFMFLHGQNSLNSFLQAQNVGINTDGSTPDASAILDVKASDKGLLVPRVSLTNVSSASPISSPATGLLVYNTNASLPGGNGEGFYVWLGSGWNRLDLSNSGDWRLTGNAGTSPSTNYLGTSDATDLSIRTHGAERIRVSSSGAVRLNTYTTNNVVKTSGGDGTLTVGAVNLASSEVTGVLPVNNGGTGVSSLAANGVVLGNGTSPVTTVAPGAAGNVLLSDGTTWTSNDGSGQFIRNQNSADQTANFRITGTGRANTSFQAPLYTRADAGTVAIRPFSNSTTAIQLQDAGGSSILNVDATNSRVGIGTTAPSHSLHSSGAIRAESGFLANDGTAGVPSYRFNSTASTGMYLGAANALSFTTSGTERVRILSGGQVNAANALSVGATIPYTPNTLFDVVGGASGAETRLATLRSNFSADNTGSFLAFINSTSSSSNVGAEIGSVTTTASNGASQLIFRTHGGGGTFGALLERMRLTNQGFLGIGTTNPLDMLHVDNSASGASSARIGRTSTQFDNRMFFGDGSYVYVGELNADDRLYLRGTTMTIDIGGSTGGANGRVLTSNGTTVSWQPPVPIGAIIAWVNHLTGTPSLPPGWVECNGGTVSDSESPINGQPIPNLNNTPSGTFGTPSGGYYLRGTTGTTGGTQADRTANFEINQDNVNDGCQICSITADGASTAYTGWMRNYYLDDRIRIRYTGGEVRPVTYTVRWIMRIK